MTNVEGLLFCLSRGVRKVRFGRKILNLIQYFSSNRSIKRKRFDDEIVEYSVGQQTRPRTQSQSFPGTSFDLPSPQTPQPPTPISAPPVLVPVVALPNPVVVHQPIMQEKRKVMKSFKKKKNIKTHGNGNKDLGRWKPTDDLALIIGIQQTNDIRTVHRGVKFSCKFTSQELSNRWHSLMYDEPINRIAIGAMRNLHPEMIASVQSKALFSKAEEEILATIKSSESPTIETFQELLTKNATVFYHARTSKCLLVHWELMRQYSLLVDQSIPPNNSTPDGLQTFSDFEEKMNDTELLAEHRDENLDIEMALADRKNKREIRTIENELSRWSVLLDNVTGIGISPEFDSQTLAILRGRAVRYLMRSREITFGRNSNDFVVDVNLSLEGAAYKVSRKQGTIKLRSNGDFFIVNEGKRPIFIDGAPVITGGRTKLNNNNVIEVRKRFSVARRIFSTFEPFSDLGASLHLPGQLRSDSGHSKRVRKAHHASELNFITFSPLFMSFKEKEE